MSSYFTTTITRELMGIHSDTIKMTDKDEESGLVNYCYNYCSSSDDDVVKATRGVVFDGETVVSRSFGYTPEYSDSDETELRELFTEENCRLTRFFVSHEGTLIRVFHYKNKWYKYVIVMS